MKKIIPFAIIPAFIMCGCNSYTDKNGDKKIVIAETDAARISRDKNQAYEFMKVGNNQEAAKLLQGLVNEKKTDKEVYYYLAISNAALGKNEEAINNCNAAIALDPNYYGSYLNRGIFKFKLNGSENALVDVNKAISINPQDPDAYMNRGIIYSELKQNEKACEDIKKAKELGGEVPEELYKMVCEPK
jgi:Flp pilus assembly protein TadD